MSKKAKKSRKPAPKTSAKKPSKPRPGMGAY